MKIEHLVQWAKIEMSKSNYGLALVHLDKALRIALYVCNLPITDQNVRNIQNMRHSAFQERRSN